MIRLLDKNISDKIAAGEVIERPISIVKELVENSIDAGASEITVEIKNGGKQFIRVTDNGCGIPRQEAETAFLRHATSKIETLADLASIGSLGFRGEALASIAAVTRTTLVTKTEDARTGCRIVIHGGDIIENAGIGCPDGTTFIITDLFYNTPARRQFLKSDSAESGLIIDFMSEMALAWTDRKFQLINNGKSLFRTPGNGNLKSTIEAVYHRREYRDLVEVDYQQDGYTVTGCISKPSLSRSTRRDQVYFVNGRIVKSKIMERGVSEGYRERLFEGRYPVVFLYLHTDPATIDVNIHPNKREVRFHDEQAVISVLRKGIVEALGEKQAVIDAGDYFTQKTDQEKKQEEQVDIKQILSNMRKKTDETLSKQMEPSFVHEPRTPFVATKDEEAPKMAGNGTSYGTKTPGNETFHEAKASGSEEPKATPAHGMPDQWASDDFANPVETETQPKVKARTVDVNALDLHPPVHEPFDFNDLNITGCIFDTYVTAEDGRNFYLIDQHAAQERIFYEQLVGEYLSDEKASQSILTPITLEVSLRQKEEEYDWLDSLRDLGYAIEEFGPNSYIVREIPYFMEIQEAERFLKDFTDHIGDGQKLQNTVVIDKLITRSCKAAIKAHDHMSDMELRQLITDLAKCRNPFSCPHGRPTFIRFTTYDIEKMFKRA